MKPRGGGSVGFCQNELLASDGMTGSQRPRPSATTSPMTFGWMKYLRNSLATVTFLAPFGISPLVYPTMLGIGFPASSVGEPGAALVTTSSAYHSRCLLLIASSARKGPTTAITLGLPWNAAFAAAALQLIT